MNRLVIILLFCTSSLFAQTKGHIFVVRHAERVDEKTDALSDQGTQRAACLASTLKSANIRTILTSELQRTQQTAKPTSEEFKTSITPVKADDISAISAKARAALKSGDVLIVGHGNTVQPIVKSLASEDVTVAPNEYDRLFVIDPSGVAQLHYCPAANAEPVSTMK